MSDGDVLEPTKLTNRANRRRRPWGALWSGVIVAMVATMTVVVATPHASATVLPTRYNYCDAPTAVAGGAETFR